MASQVAQLCRRSSLLLFTGATLCLTHYKCTYPRSNINTQATLESLHTSAHARTSKYLRMLANACAAVLRAQILAHISFDTYIHARNKCGQPIQTYICQNGGAGVQKRWCAWGTWPLLVAQVRQILLVLYPTSLCLKCVQMIIFSWIFARGVHKPYSIRPSSLMTRFG